MVHGDGSNRSYCSTHQRKRQIKMTEYKRLNNGIYDATPIEWKLSERANGDPYVSVVFEVETQPGVVSGIKPMAFLGMTDKVIGKTTEAEITVKSLRDLGFPGDGLSELEIYPPPKIKTKIELYGYEKRDGTQGQGVRLLRKDAAPLDQSKIKALDSRFANLFRTIKSTAKDVVPF